MMQKKCQGGWCILAIPVLESRNSSIPLEVHWTASPSTQISELHGRWLPRNDTRLFSDLHMYTHTCKHVNVCTCTLAHIHAVEEELEVNKPEQVCRSGGMTWSRHHPVCCFCGCSPSYSCDRRGVVFAEWTRASAPWEGASGAFNVSRGGG